MPLTEGLLVLVGVCPGLVCQVVVLVMRLCMQVCIPLVSVLACLCQILVKIHKLGSSAH